MNNNMGSPAQIKNYQRLYNETKEELKTLVSKVNSAKSKGTNTPEYRYALHQYYNKQLENLDFLDKLNKVQGKKVDLTNQINQIKKRLEFLKKAQKQASSLQIKNVQNKTNKQIEDAKKQQNLNVSKAKEEMNKKMEEYKLALRQWHQGDKKTPPPIPPSPVQIPNVQIPTQQLPPGFLQPQKISEIRNIIRDILNEGKNPFEVINYYLKSEPKLIQKLQAKDNALLKKLASLDIEYNPEKLEVGKIFPWLLNLWKKNDPDLINLLKSGENSESVIKFKNAQQLFNKPSFRKSIQTTDIQKFKSLSDFVNKVNQAFLEPEQIPSMATYGIEEINKDIRDGVIMKTNLTNDNYLVVSPLKKKGACKYGNTHIGSDEGRWCTAKEENNAFDSYKDGILYIFMDKKDNLKSKYQFYYKEDNFQFQDEYNKAFDYKEFFNQNIDVFEKLFPDVPRALKSDGKTELPSYYKRIIKYFPKTYFDLYLKQIEKYVSMFLVSIKKIINGELNAEEFFNKENIGIDYDDIDFYDNGLRIHFSFDEYNQTLNSFYWAYKHGYSGYDFNTDEYDYIYHYVKKEDKKLFLDLIKIFEPSFTEEKFDQEGEIYRVIDQRPAYQYFEDLLQHFATNYEEAINDAQTKWIDDVFEKMPITIENDSIFVEYKKIYDYCIERSYTSPSTLESIFENMLDHYGINDDTYYDYYNNNIDYSAVNKGISEDLKEVQSEIEENFEGIEEYKKSKDKFDKYIKDLKFERDWHHHYYLRKPEFEMGIKRFDFAENKVYIQYKNLKTKEDYEGWISVDDIPKYATMEMMFENKIRNMVREIIKNKTY